MKKLPTLFCIIEPSRASATYISLNDLLNANHTNSLCQQSAPCPGSTGRKKPFLQQAHECHQTDCSKSYKTSNGLHMHFGKSLQCCNFKMSGNNTRANTALLPPALNAQESLTEYRWDEDDSLHESEIASSIEDNISSDAPNRQAGVYTESPKAAALRFGIGFTTAQLHKTKVLQLFSDANAPHYLYKNVIEWGLAAVHDEYNFHPTRTTQTAQVKYLEKWLKFQKCRPRQIPTNLPGPGDQVVQTTYFEFTNQLYSLVSDRALFGNLDNLDVNVDNPFGKYVPPNGLLSTINSGQWYNLAYQHEVKDPSKDFVMPIIFACYEKHLQKGGKAAFWPLLFTTSILNQQTRTLPIAWRTLGYINI
jgi:hypothetical protein